MPPSAQRPTPQCPVWRQTATGPRRFFLKSTIRRLLALAQGGIKPGPGKRPVAVGRASDDAQGPGRLIERQSREETELDKLGTGRVFLRQPFQGVIEEKQLVRGIGERKVDALEA